ncbi:hypothetical protein MCOR27_002313 [Pyricularia oryzae]|uniref:Methyltransferase type 11 domain-containing protein n=2 Tax=Pyricularia TaxID=48558 RepID=A0ABQ8NX09_PYRGI|nr:hypothetical protein MCOR01_000395 [Pyricularia oryzae]KAI6303381.1 hypothetical protein MCOR33_001471 [Pyricularia grisea]KAH9427880.1 hypothetical protein MCOR02_011379 [Pyricularia oryzae]KAI6262063.1 hypothetical protein MCOR19_001731 [Pyricularia oryzae]KAI6282885.1 hypothetical protein MCOR26_002638 [Pyricularia oryzae]
MADTKELAQTYTAVNNTQYDAGLFLLKQLGLEPGMRVLDVGCGPGNITSYLADVVGASGEVVGVDPSEERIDLARAKITSPGESSGTGARLSFFVGTAEDLSRFATGSFDAVYCNSTLHWVRDQPLALREFARVLKPGGRLGVSGQSGDFVAAHEAIAKTVLGREPYAAYDHSVGAPRFLKRAEMESLLDAAGFGSRSFAINPIFKSTKNGDEMISWLESSSSGKTYGGIPVEMRPQARKEMLVEWDKLTTAEGLTMQLDLLVTVAFKP